LPFRYQGQYEDVETGLYYNRYRYYNPEEAVYISQDPIRIQSQELNLYAYVNDPNFLTDIFGLEDRFPSWMNTRQGYQRQHIIPYSLRNHDLFTSSGMSINGASNMMYLPVVKGIDPNPLKGLHRGWTTEHARYNEMVKDMMDDLHAQARAERWDYRRTQQEIQALQKHLREGFHNGTYTCAS
jgi:RHS repeat-associated protein